MFRRPINTSGVTTTIRGELYTSNPSAIAAQYGQQLIQQEHLRRFQESYNTSRQNTQNAQQQQYTTLNRQQQTVPSAFQPTANTSTSSYTNYSLYDGHY